MKPCFWSKKFECNSIKNNSNTLFLRCTAPVVKSSTKNRRKVLSADIPSPVFINDPHWFGSAGSGSRRAKKGQKKESNFMVWSACCSLSRTEGFSCSMDVLHEGVVGIIKMQILIWKIGYFSSWNNLHFLVITPDPDPHWNGSTTLTRIDRCALNFVLVLNKGQSL